MKTMMMVGMAVVGIIMGLSVSPGNCGRENERCRVPTEFCTMFQEKVCCGGLHCVSDHWHGVGGHCVPYEKCIAQGRGCNLLTQPCCYPNHCSSFDGHGKCVPWSAQYGSQAQPM